MTISSNSIEIRNCIFGFRCVADWNEMLPIAEPNVRHCDVCEKSVHRVKNVKELSKAIKINRCVAITVKSEFGFESILSGYVERYDPQSN